MYALEVAEAILPGGTIDIVDDQPRLLEVAIRRARERGLGNVTAVFTDVRYLPFDDGSFDAAYLIATLGRATDPEAALTELARVLRSDGRVVVGELHDDPHMVGPAGYARSQRRPACGFRVEAQRTAGTSPSSPQRAVGRDRVRAADARTAR